ncbi:hypothetical protein D3C73_437440 [compost metagenome]
MNYVVISDTDIIVHMVKGNIFFEVIPIILDKVYITPKVEEELKNKHAGIYYQLLPIFVQGKWLFKAKDMWKLLTDDQRIMINQTREKHRARLDPGELDCLAFATGLGIHAIISDDRGAKEIISEVTENQKVIITFWDLLIMGAKKDRIPWSVAEEYYQRVRLACLPKHPDFKYQIGLFEKNILPHPWVQHYLNSSNR